MRENDLAWAQEKVRTLLLEIAFTMRDEAITALEAATRLEEKQ